MTLYVDAIPPTKPTRIISACRIYSHISIFLQREKNKTFSFLYLTTLFTNKITLYIPGPFCVQDVKLAVWGLLDEEAILKGNLWRQSITGSV